MLRYGYFGPVVWNGPGQGEAGAGGLRALCGDGPLEALGVWSCRDLAICLIHSSGHQEEFPIGGEGAGVGYIQGSLPKHVRVLSEPSFLCTSPCSFGDESHRPYLQGLNALSCVAVPDFDLE